jgi:hypothetical protein
LITSFSLSGSVTANGCPSSAPVTGNNCYFIAANGSDANSGTSESSPWLHAPGMPNCKNNCAAVKPTAGKGFIFRGGDTWHFGNSSASPYTGGTWDMYSQAWGTTATCLGFGLTTAGCIYYGVDQNWFTGASWTRPVLTGDNPTSTSLVASCAHQIPNTGAFVTNTLVSMAPNSILDNFELTGLCSQDVNISGTNQDIYIANLTTGTAGLGMDIVENVYIHGWTATTTAGTGTNVQPGVLISGGFNGLQSFDHIVIDGADSNPGSFAWGTFPSFYHLRDSIIRNTHQGVGAWCHDIHDNIFENIFEHNPGAGSHSNILECNTDNTGNAPNQPQNTPNVFYNNIVRHVSSTFIADGQVNLWFCPNTIPEYWFNNVIFDAGASGNFWAYAGPPIYGCQNTGGQFMFNNTFADGNQICHITTDSTGGQFINISNEHLINSPYFSDNTTCTGGTSATNIAQSDAVATAQGYTTGSNSGTISGATNNCVNATTTPCAPTSAGNSTVGAGVNHMAYCNTLATFSSEPAIGTEAANACKFGTTDACAYNTSTHTMNCPARAAVARPASTAWDAGAYQFSGSQVQAPQAPTNLQAAVQ